MTGTPDKIINHLPNTCDCCGNELSRFQSICVGKRQVVDIPPVKPEYTEHRIYQTTCSCGKTTESKYPQQVKTPISYGSNVESLIGYFHSRQYLPTDRMRELFHDLFGLPVSEGGIPYILNRLSKKALPSYESIRGKIATSQVIGTDETGVKINGKNHWYWTWQNQELTFIVPSDNRGFKTIEDNFDHKFHQAILVHDCWKSHFQIGRRHQLCLVHLLRELNYFTESHKLAWPRQFKKMLKKAIEIKKQMKPENYNDHYQPRSEIEKILERLLNKQVNPNFKELVSFKKRMTKYRDYLFTFLHHLHVPPENNASERAIRNIKVKQKISGQFKSMKGAIQFAILRSITDTAIKNDQKVLNTLFEIADLKATE